uniref:Uncharacterized protein n=1 Tax=Rhizophora mucronata TaxID=61149 RepID=A0A2P2PNK9_RHIMU
MMLQHSQTEDRAAILVDHDDHDYLGIAKDRFRFGLRYGCCLEIDNLKNLLAVEEYGAPDSPLVSSIAHICDSAVHWN